MTFEEIRKAAVEQLCAGPGRFNNEGHCAARGTEVHHTATVVVTCSKCQAQIHLWRTYLDDSEPEPAPPADYDADFTPDPVP